ncbi:MAG TPA: hypothetical protein DEA96_12025, partial [Leptospiraceae bacterium]|nr:hypothetical protein [Leptospiraceae bacterium]
DIGGGFMVRRTLPSRNRRMVGPFIFFDHMGPMEFAPGSGMDVLPHPHIGLATVTYLFEGEILHRDSVGSEQLIRPGAINWMVAGSGIVHSERVRPEIRASGQTLHGLQIWVALPQKAEDNEPAFFHHPADSFPELDLHGASVRVLIGEIQNHKSPVVTFSRMLYAETKLDADFSWTVPSLEKEQAVYVAMGSIEAEGQTYSQGTMIILKNGASLEIRSRERSILMLLGGDPMEKRKIYWNFVHSDPEMIENAKRRWQNQEFPAVDGETEFVPLPESRKK